MTESEVDQEKEDYLFNRWYGSNQKEIAKSFECCHMGVYYKLCSYYPSVDVVQQSTAVDD